MLLVSFALRGKQKHRFSIFETFWKDAGVPEDRESSRTMDHGWHSIRSTRAFSLFFDSCFNLLSRVFSSFSLLATKLHF